MARAFVALGSNLGDMIGALREAVRRIEALAQTEVIAKSAVYRTPPWGMLEQDAFANAVIAVETALSPEAMLEACLGIEAAMGRIREVRWGPRVIDLDLLYHGRARRNSARLTLPHPAITERAFVLIPLGDVAPEKRPKGRAIAKLLATLDTSGIERLEQGL